MVRHAPLARLTMRKSSAPHPEPRRSRESKDGRSLTSSDPFDCSCLSSYAHYSRSSLIKATPLITNIISFFLTELVLSLSPGPAVMFVLNGALTSGYRSGIHRGLGILSGNVIYFALSATVIASLIINFPILFHSVELVGSLYLAKIALTSFSTASSGLKPNPNSIAETTTTRAAIKEFSKSLLLQLTNPKMIIFFVSILPMFFHGKDNTTTNIIYLTLASLIAESIAFSVYIFVGSLIRTNELFTKYVNMIGNTFILIIAIVAFAESSSKIIADFQL